jgi:hypothetical protein
MHDRWIIREWRDKRVLRKDVTFDSPAAWNCWAGDSCRWEIPREISWSYGARLKTSAGVASVF